MKCKKIRKETILITGASGGIGKSCSEIFASEGFNVVMADIDKKALNSVSENLKRKNLSVLPIYTDVSDPTSVENMVNKAIETYGMVDVLINNAALQSVFPFLKLPDEEWCKIMRTNLTGAFLCSKRISEIMVKCGGGKIINMLSVHYNKPRKNKIHYDCSKAAVAMLTKEMALELFEYNITVNAVSFGAVNTSMNLDWINNSKERERVLEKIPLKKIFEPENIAKFTFDVVNLFSNDTTGTIFNIDGGRSLI